MNTYRRVLQFVRPYTARIAVSTALSILLSALSTVAIAIIWPILRVIFPQSGSTETPIAMPIPKTDGLSSIKTSFINFINDLVVVPGDKMGSLRNLCLIVIAIFVLKNAAKITSNVLTTTIDEGIVKDIRDRLFNRLLHQGMDFYNARRSGDLISVMNNDIGAMNVMLTPTLNTLMREPVQAVLMILLLLSFSPELTLLAFSTSILSLILIRVLRTFIRRYSLRLQLSLGEIMARLQEAFQNIRIIKGFSAETFEHARFQKETSWYKRTIVKFSAVTNLMSPSSEIFAIGAIAAVLYFGGYQVINHQLAADELITFLFLLFAVMSPINTMISIPATIQRSMVAAERVFTVMDLEPSVRDGTLVAAPLHNAIEFVNVSFAYNDSVEVLKNISIKIPHGHTVALVGPSGGGKSTLMDLIVRFYDPTSGEVRYDGTPVTQFTIESYRSKFGIVTQEPLLFNDTVFNNIAYSISNASKDDVIKAAMAANAHDFIAALPMQYESKIGDRGVLLSGGQRQRIAIARSLMLSPSILLFDEATSALDSESEKAVQEAIDRLLVGRTAVVIAHRLSTIRKAHKIIVVEAGRIVEEGTHDELIARAGAYNRLYQLQFATAITAGTN